MRQLIVDGSHMAARSRFAQGELRRTDGQKSGTVHGFLQSLSFARNTLNLQLHQVWVVWDGGRAPYRMEIFPDYKRRKPFETIEEKLDHEHYITQLQALRRVTPFLGVNQIRVDGAEADDLIALLAVQMREAGDSPIVFSGDKDFHQLCDIADIFDPKRKLMSKEDVLARYEFKNPLEIVLAKAITGDSSDNINGVHGVGEKLAKAAVRCLGGHFLSGLGQDEPKNGKEARAVKLTLGQKAIVNRNLELVKLPRRWQEPPGYGEDQFGIFQEQVQTRPRRNTREFIKFLREWELKHIEENVSRW